jgi:hypothetical protein
MPRTLADLLTFSKPKYPVTCDKHGPRPRCYTVCICVAKSFEPVAFVDRASNTRMGIVHCKRTNHRKDKAGAFEWVVMCDLCVEEAHRIDRVGGSLIPQSPEGIIV